MGISLYDAAGYENGNAKFRLVKFFNMKIISESFGLHLVHIVSNRAYNVQ